MTTVGPIGSAPVGNSMLDSFSPNALTAESLMLYLETRLNSLDSQINAIFKKQQNLQEIRKAMDKMQLALDKLKDDKGDTKLQGEYNTNAKGEPVADGSAAYEKEILHALDQIAAVDPKLAAEMKAEMSKEGQIMYCPDGKYFTAEVAASREYINNISKQLESSAQMEMISLQSFMSSRQTAIQLATNSVAAVNKGSEAIVGNIGR